MVWIIVGVVVVLYFVLAALKKSQQNQSAEILDKFKDKKVLKSAQSANFFGQQSQGMAQMRGNGALILTDNELYFQMLMPKKELHIPISSISQVETPKSFLGKSKFMPLLKVEYKDDKGQTDAAAWLVKDLSAWKEAIEKLK